MNGIEKITKRMLDDAQVEIDGIVKQAEDEAAAILARYEAQASREYDELYRRGAERAQEREENLAGAAQLEARKDTLAAKQSMLDKAFQQAATKLSSLTEAQYITLLAKLAASSSFSGTESVVLSAADQKKLGATVVTEANALLEKEGRTAKLTLSQDTRETGGGLLLHSGNIETNCTFETLLRLVRNEISGEVASALFD